MATLIFAESFRPSEEASRDGSRARDPALAWVSLAAAAAAGSSITAAAEGRTSAGEGGSETPRESKADGGTSAGEGGSEATTKSEVVATMETISQSLAQAADDATDTDKAKTPNATNVPALKAAGRTLAPRVAVHQGALVDMTSAPAAVLQLFEASAAQLQTNRTPIGAARGTLEKGKEKAQDLWEMYTEIIVIALAGLLCCCAGAAYRLRKQFLEDMEDDEW